MQSVISCVGNGHIGTVGHVGTGMMIGHIGDNGTRGIIGITGSDPALLAPQAEHVSGGGGTTLHHAPR